MSMEEMLKYKLDEHEKRMFKSNRRKSEIHYSAVKNLSQNRKSSLSSGPSSTQSSVNLSVQSSRQSSRKSSVSGLKSPRSPRSRSKSPNRSKSPFNPKEEEDFLQITRREKRAKSRKLSFDLSSK